MKLVLILFLTVSFGLEAQESECDSEPGVVAIDETTEHKEIDPKFINHIARKIFNEETEIYDFIGVNCFKNYNDKKGQWLCSIRQSATKFENGKYTVNPPGKGEWMLIIDFIDNTYELKRGLSM
jgi:hypothetical protein